jgi:pre-mRNA-processing factor SLU7
MTHDAKMCMDRPRKLGAKYTNKFIAPDEKIETFELDFDGKRDRWNGYDASTYSRVIDSYEMRDEARRKYQKEQQLKKLEEKNSNLQLPADKDSDEDEDEDKDGGDSSHAHKNKIEIDCSDARQRKTKGKEEQGGSEGAVVLLLFL